MSKADDAPITGETEQPNRRTALMIGALAAVSISTPEVAGTDILPKPSAADGVQPSGGTEIERLHREFQSLTAEDENLRRQKEKAVERLAQDLQPLMDPEIVVAGLQQGDLKAAASETGHFVLLAEPLYEEAQKPEPKLDDHTVTDYERVKASVLLRLHPQMLSKVREQYFEYLQVKREAEIKNWAARLAPLAERYWKAHDEAVERLGIAALDARIEAVSYKLEDAEDAILREPPLSVGDLAIKGRYVIAAQCSGYDMWVEQHLEEVQAYFEKQASDTLSA